MGGLVHFLGRGNPDQRYGFMGHLQGSRAETSVTSAPHWAATLARAKPFSTGMVPYKSHRIDGLISGPAVMSIFSVER